jgi:hypothetical protein
MVRTPLTSRSETTVARVKGCSPSGSRISFQLPTSKRRFNAAAVLARGM